MPAKRAAKRPRSAGAKSRDSGRGTKRSRSGARVRREFGVVFSAADKSSTVHLTPDRLTMTGGRTFRTVRTTHGLARGVWFWESRLP
ncbi:hypothetical protein FNF31_02407 [Cafeteria roenbergensis]|uniref:Uncharacterized protein n=1 Tax=Cafeteria roenbergensis TaxID=33653 RepID=A0A5A8DG59_CAFRO|nr:hypothetical protein FNF31_02407 [Cafeteria roenbergensis]